MEITVKRTETNKAYTAGTLSANGKTVANYTLEYTSCMIPTGIYQITIVNDPTMTCRQIAVVDFDHDPTDSNPRVMATLLSGNSYLNVTNTPNVVIGEKLIPGAVVNSRKVFIRLFDRIEKCVARGERIELNVTDLTMVERTVPTFWLIPTK
ncbi:MAG: DUF5675 family protein [Prevotella sp.]